MDNKQIEAFIARVKEFPTLPTIYSRLMDVMSNPRSTAHDVADIISQDQAAASKVLKVANSSLYGFYGKINTISKAITYIGFDEVKNLVIALSIFNIFSDAKKNYLMNPIDLWKHSIGVAVTTRLIGKTIGVKNVENYFLAGILHQLGKLFLYKIQPDEYTKVIAYALSKQIPVRDAEQEKLGITYTVAGELLAEKWNLPKSIKDAIRYHYLGDTDGHNKQMVAAIHIAKTAMIMMKIGVHENEVVPEPNLKSWKNLELPPKFFTNNLNAILKSYEESSMTLLSS